MQAANEGRATNKGMSIAGIALGVLSIVLLIVSYAAGLNERLLSGEGLWGHVHPGRWGVLPVEMRLFPGCDTCSRVDSVLRFTPGKE